MLAEALLAHLVGDYVLQSDWMATQKVKRWWPAVAHGLAYSLPFLLITQSPWALLVIGGTHVVLDHYRAAKYVIWAKNLIAPRKAWVPWSEASQNQGFPATVPNGRATALVVVVDNTLHLLINAAALVWLG
ncbi:DUF3307 domain-containing protein [Thermomonospora umbrina]|uniref:Uncharacterized protein DUF3307 n=1 Tax=Thermomonospora umbrina TaxID=111806 RepID=A0A3D9T957_9ACTN|nr:DUF3307 domain-containing protein [Thermomonospora umbrina]REF00292.1 uncharacterized protein DUF3307 [Thermomonospora umbrina]